MTTDNGSEFLQYEELVKSALAEDEKRFDVYYCHSFAAWEKGTNENTNRMIRRFFPKGTDFSQVTPEQVAEVEKCIHEKSWGGRLPSMSTRRDMLYNKNCK